MDFLQALTELYRERERLTTVIRNLESLTGETQQERLSRRGRKNMSPAERAQVSERMRKYWASRRGKQAS
jgi:hypothetical protein